MTIISLECYRLCGLDQLYHRNFLVFFYLLWHGSFWIGLVIFFGEIKGELRNEDQKSNQQQYPLRDR